MAYFALPEQCDNVELPGYDVGREECDSVEDAEEVGLKSTGTLPPLTKCIGISVAREQRRTKIRQTLIM